ncbi:hypothetical protein BJ508DRAFT_414806 [Ascobolus immersus RN42]|uniref:Uncharacterized protein n=1 Tax=Ascobolus immersus RN42 TaxID=1160509 RepID=A0A3N4IB45_ASCIM|nr:hypothetical protein BJ508DRAFT_414806 [Ascobolus immersus RN42]
MTISNNDKLTIAAGFALLAVAAYTTHKQLAAFRDRCIVGTETGKGTEGSDTIELDTLATIAKGPNYDLRNAALKIISQRAFSGTAYDALLAQIRSKNATNRVKGVRTLRCLHSLALYDFLDQGSGNIQHICTVQTCKALVKALINCRSERDQRLSEDQRGERETLYLLWRLAYWQREVLVQAGIMDYIKLLDKELVKESIEQALGRKQTDGAETLIDVLAFVLDVPNGRKQLEEAGLLPTKSETDDVDGGVGTRSPILPGWFRGYEDLEMLGFDGPEVTIPNQPFEL